jgi:flagellar basal-body rod protein FlgF
MTRGIETAASGMVGIMALNDVLANNLANINTPGFKQSNVTFKSVQDVILKKSDISKGEDNAAPLGSISLGSTTDAVAIDFRQGGIKFTSNPLDLAIDGKGFFEVQTPDGTAYTRNGSFKRLSNGTIATNEGYLLLGAPDGNGKSKPIELKDTNVDKVIVNSDGSIVIDGQIANKVKIVEFKDVYKLQPEGNSLYKFVDPTNDPKNKPHEAKHCQVSQRALEASNANVVETMVNSIAGMRTYDSLSRVIDSEKNILGKTVNEVGRLK